MNTAGLTVRTHVARDLLQSAALFKTDRLVVWEYVSNGLQYRDPLNPPVVDVVIDSQNKSIKIHDNGQGMDREDLKHFFTMHGENLERQKGRGGRGRFGTGKAAAFGIADMLSVSSVRQGLRNTVELHRADVERAGAGEIPVRVKERDVSTESPNGTLVTVSGIHLRRFDERGVVRYIERHLARWQGKPKVIVNGCTCEYVDPPIAREYSIAASLRGFVGLGDAVLTLQVTKQPLEQDQQGVNVYANGTWIATTLAGAEGQPLSQYICGMIDVPALDDDTSVLPAFDMTRSMQLNPSNSTVQDLLAFVGYEVDQLRRSLVKEDTNRRAREEAKKLAREAKRIAELINKDFDEFSRRVAKVKAQAAPGVDSAPPAPAIKGSTSEQELLSGDGTVPGSLEDVGAKMFTSGNGEANGVKDSPDAVAHLLRRTDDGDKSGSPAAQEASRRKARGGFTVEFREMGLESSRATYSGQTRTIYVNLDHPQIAAAKGTKSVEEPNFIRLAYEVAFAEYAVALASELAAHNEYIEVSDAIYDIRDTLNRMARRAASLYSE